MPDIIPFNARLLYYAQCAWGTNPLHTNSDVTPEARSKLVESLLCDCANIISEKVKGDRDLKNWFRELEDDIEDNIPIDDERIRKLLNYALKWSGGEQLWAYIGRRIRESFFELVVLPILLDIFKSYDSFASSVNLFIQTRQIGNLEDVKQKQEKLTRFRQEFPNLGKKINDDFNTELQEYIDAIKSKDQNQINQIIQKAEAKKRKGFQPIFSTIEDIESDLMTDIIIPIRDAFKNNKGAYDLKDELQDFISPRLAENIAREYDNVSRRITVNFTSYNGYLVKKVRMDDKKKIQELEHDEKYVRLFFYTIKDGLTARAEFTLQAKEKSFTNALDALVKDQITRLILCIPEEILDSLDITLAIINDIEKKLNKNLTKLPKKLFDFYAGVEGNTFTNNEQIGTKIEKKEKEVGSCLNKKTETYIEKIPEYGNIEYKQLLIPNIDTMAQQWANGIENSKSDLLDILFDWIADNLNDSTYLFNESVNNILNLTERFLNEQSHKLWEQQLELEKLAILESCYHSVNNLRQELAQKFQLIDKEVINDGFI
ncbi:hypothetical protein [Geminocystis herdmanii]|uniref:hypothetical protein n=1 Tax=Geminocystis herdmanii TaxID=669359 RepID=UPI00034BF46A|nr:hypothetical protein [Geminocystis herdmanii]